MPEIKPMGYMVLTLQRDADKWEAAWNHEVYATEAEAMETTHAAGDAGKVACCVGVFPVNDVALLAERDATIARLTAAISGEGDCTCACSEGGPEEIDDLCPTDGIIASAKARAEQWGHQLDEIAQALGGEWLEPFPPSDVATEVTRRLATIARLEAVRDLTDDAWHSIWLHGRWRWLTKQMTTESKNAVADAVERYWAVLGEGSCDVAEQTVLALRWWDTEQCHCGHQQGQHRALYGGWTVAELIDPFGGRCKDCDCVRYRLTYAAPVLGSQVDVTRADSTGGGEAS